MIQGELARLLSAVGEREPAATDVLVDAVAVNRALSELSPRDSDPDRWASLQNEIGYSLTLIGRRANDPARFEEALPILREAISVQRQIKAVPAIAFTEDSLCDVLTDLGAIKKDKAMAEEAVATCTSALAIFREHKIDGLIPISETNLAEAEQLLATLK